jgi:hypothetical protein
VDEVQACEWCRTAAVPVLRAKSSSKSSKGVDTAVCWGRPGCWLLLHCRA